MGESSGGVGVVSDVPEDVAKSVSIPKAKNITKENQKVQKCINISKERKNYMAFEIVFVSDQNYAWSIEVGKSPDEIRATLRTFKGLNRVHRQFYHLSAKEM